MRKRWLLISALKTEAMVQILGRHHPLARQAWNKCRNNGLLGIWALHLPMVDAAFANGNHEAAAVSAILR